jgi:hypothetical protein
LARCLRCPVRETPGFGRPEIGVPWRQAGACPGLLMPAPRCDCPPVVPRPAALQRNPAGLAGHSCLSRASRLLGEGALAPIDRGQGPLHPNPNRAGGRAAHVVARGSQASHIWNFRHKSTSDH